MRRVLTAFLLTATALTAAAAPIALTTSLRDLGTLRPERVAGLAGQRDFYVPLASRDFDPAKSRVTVTLQPSPFLAPESVVSVLVNDREVATRRVGGEAPVTLSGPVPRGTKADDPANNVLKLSVRTVLALPRSADRDPATTTAQAWIDVLPESSFTCALRSDDPDWLAVARLPFTLQPHLALARNPDWNPVQETLALRVVSWVARTAPRSELHFGPDAPAETAFDRIVVESPREGAPVLEITSNGTARVIHVRAGTGSESAAAWTALRQLAVLRVPGSGWKIAAPDESAKAIPATAVPLSTFDPEWGVLRPGRGESRARLAFERSALGSGQLVLRLSGHCAPAAKGAEPRLAVLLNDQLVFTAEIEAGETAFAWDIPLPPDALRGMNDLTVTMLGADAGTPLLWQIHPDSALVLADKAAPPPPDDLLDAARGVLADDEVTVTVVRPELWPVAANAVAWLQRVNPRRQLEPTFAAEPSPGAPALLIGALGGRLASSAKAPVLPSPEGLAITSRGRSGTLRIAPTTSAGFWQLGEWNGAPVLLADPWGPEGDAALAQLSAQLARTVWIEDGDVVIGDGLTPPLTFATRDRRFSAAAAPVVSAGPPTTAIAPTVVAPPPASPVSPWRWALIGGLWILLSGVILWIFDRTRRHATV